MTETFADDPTYFFGSSSAKAHGISRNELDRLQLKAIQARFETMHGVVPPLKALAQEQGIEAINDLETLPAVLFPHSIYKAYPEQLITAFDFPKLTKWLSRLTCNDLSAVADRNFETLDAWQDALDTETEIDIIHSSGTTGRLSFYPRGKKELKLQYSHARMTMADWVEPRYYDFDKPGFTIVWPSYAKGRSALLKMPRAYRNYYATSPDDFHALIPLAMSTDHQYYLMQANAHKDTGFRLAPEPSAYVHARIQESVELKNNADQRTAELLDRIEKDLRQNRILLAGSPLNIYEVAKAGLERGMENALAPGSVVRTFGGLKGVPAPDDLNQVILQFSGVSEMKYGYGMTELSTGFDQCSAGRYHVPPWIIAYILEPLTGNPKPREGVQEGRGAFFDLVAQTYWGGVISADHLQISWNPCSCGRTTPHISDDIKRVTDTPEQEHYIGPAPEAAIDAALAALNEGLG